MNTQTVANTLLVLAGFCFLGALCLGVYGIGILVEKPSPDYEITLDTKTYGDSVMIRDLRTDEVTVVHFDSLQTTIDKFQQ